MEGVPFKMSTAKYTCHQLAPRTVPFIMGVRFPCLGDEGFEFVKASLGIRHADCCEKMCAVSLTILFGYLIVGIASLHSIKG